MHIFEHSGEDEKDFPDQDDLKNADVDFLEDREDKDVEPDGEH